MSLSLRLLFAISVLGNIGLLGYFTLRPAPAYDSKTGRRTTVKTTAARPASTQANNPPPADTWEHIQSGDMSAYTGNLRAAGLPDRLVRLIINAEINERFKAREEAARPKRAPRKYWENFDNYYNDPTTLDQRLAQLDLRREKAALRKELLGEDPPKPDDDNPIPSAKRDQLRQITEDYDTMISQIERESRGIQLPSDEEKLRYLRAEKDKEMKSLLSPDELKEYELRSSQTANQMRWSLNAFSPTENEFRSLYAIRKSFDDQFPPQPGDPGQDYWQKRSQAEKLLNEQISQQLGPDRYKEYTRAKDWEFQNLASLTDRLGLPKTTAAQVYDMRYTVPTEAVRIAQDTTMDPATKIENLKTIAQKARDQLYAQLGKEAGDAYLKRQGGQWLTSLEKGQVIQFKPDGSQSYFHVSVPQPAKTKP